MTARWPGIEDVFPNWAGILSPHDIDRFCDRITFLGVDDCWLWTGRKKRHNYPSFTYATNSKTAGAHRLALALTGTCLPDKDQYACHKCDNPPCVNPNHLFWGTALDNVTDRVEKGRSHKWTGDRLGSKNPNAKITENDVLEIRRCNSRELDAHFAELLSVKIGTIKDIRIGAKWKHLKTELLA